MKRRPKPRSGFGRPVRGRRPELNLIVLLDANHVKIFHKGIFVGYDGMACRFLLRNGSNSVITLEQENQSSVQCDKKVCSLIQNLHGFASSAEFGKAGRA